MFKNLRIYKEVLKVENEIDQLLHLCTLKPLLNGLVYKEVPEAWYDLDFPKLKEAISDLDFFDQKVVLGYLGSTIDNKGLVAHDWTHLTEIRWRMSDDRPEVFYSKFGNVLQLPHGYYTGYEISKQYPQIAAINLFVNIYGQPFFSVLRSALETGTETLLHPKGNKLLSLSREQMQWLNEIKKIIAMNIPESGRELIQYPEDSLQNHLQFSYPGFLFFDEPSLYQTENEYLNEFIQAFSQLMNDYIPQTDNNSEEVFRKLKEGVDHLRTYTNFKDAQKCYEGLKLRLPFFPLFAWGFEQKAVQTLDKHIEEQYLKIERWKDETHDVNLVRKYVTKEFEPIIQDFQFPLKNFVGLTIEDILLVTHRLWRGSHIYPYLDVYIKYLDFATSERIIGEFLESSTFKERIDLEGMHSTDLAMIALVLWGGKYFRTKQEAAVFVSKNFRAENKHGALRNYQPSSITLRMDEILNSKGQTPWKKLKKNLIAFFHSSQ